MESLNSFLHPKNKPNLKFEVSDRFVDDEGNLIKWEMRHLTANEGLELAKACEKMDEQEAFVSSIAESIVYPDLKNKDLIEGLSKEMGRKGAVLSPFEVLIALTTDAEIALLMATYTKFNALTNDFIKKVDTAKN